MRRSVHPARQPCEAARDGRPAPPRVGLRAARARPGACGREARLRCHRPLVFSEEEPTFGRHFAPLNLSFLSQVLRSFRSLLFLRAEDVPASPLLSSGALPFSTALHFLFSKAPAELKSPHDSAGWSRSRYSAWLEEHSAEGERLQLIQVSDSLANIMKRRRYCIHQQYIREPTLQFQFIIDNLTLRVLSRAMSPPRGPGRRKIMHTPTPLCCNCWKRALRQMSDMK